MAINDIVQTIAEARVDARSLSEFVFKPAGFKVARRLAPTVDTLQFYINRFNSLDGDFSSSVSVALSSLNNSVAEAEGKVAYIESTVQDAINNTAVEGGVLADTFVTATANGVGSVARTQRDKNSDTVSIKDFGAKGDGVVDDSVPVQAAIDYCELEGATLHIPRGLYIVTNISIKCSIKADSGAVFKNKDSSTSTVIGVREVTGLIIDGLTVDGNVSADPEVWSELNYDTFTGGRCLTVAYATVACKFLNCTFRNGRRNNAYIEKSEDLVFVNCVFDKARGNFGDCVYHRESVGTKFINCQASDFTRIGFVCETGSRNITLTNCTAKNGHHASKDFGGGEYNGGFWAENSHDISYIDCYAEGTGTDGFIGTAGRYQHSDSNAPSFLYYGCTARGVIYPFTFRTFSVTDVVDGSPIEVACHVRYVNCKATQIERGIIASLDAPNSVVYIEGFHVESELGSHGVNSNTFNLVGVSTSKVYINNSVIDRLSTDYAKVYALDNNISDFASYDLEHKSSLQVFVSNLKCLDSSPIYIKFRYGQPSFNAKDCNIVVNDSFFGDFKANSCELSYFVARPKGNVSIRDCDIKLSNLSVVASSVPNQATPFWINDQSGAKSVSITNNNIINADGKSLYISNRQSTGTSGRYIFNSNIVRADVTVGTRSALRFQVKDAGSDKVLIHKNTFINSNQSGTAILPFIKTESASALVSSELNVFDSTVTNVIDLNGSMEEALGSNISTEL